MILRDLMDDGTLDRIRARWLPETEDT